MRKTIVVTAVLLLTCFALTSARSSAFTFIFKAFSSAEDAMIIDAIESLSLLEEVSCSVDCVSTVPQSSYVGGFLAMRDSTDEHLDQGNGVTYIRTTAGMRVDDGFSSQMKFWSNSNGSFDEWRANVGIEDVRIPLLLAAQSDGWAFAEGSHDVDGQDSILMESDGVRLWFDAAVPTRLLKYEVDYALPSGNTDGAPIALSVKFNNWSPVGSSELPVASETVSYNPIGEEIDSWNYVYYGFNTGFHLDDTLFEVESSGGGLGGGGFGGSLGF